MPETQLNEIEDEESHRGKGILSIKPAFLQAQLRTYYNINC